MMTLQKIIDLEKIANKVAKTLSSVHMVEQSAFITTPLIYVGGTIVTVRVDQVYDKFHVSDDRHGYTETEMLERGVKYNKAAMKYAKRCGVAYYEGEIFDTNVELKDLGHSVMWVANAAQLSFEKAMG